MEGGRGFREEQGCGEGGREGGRSKGEEGVKVGEEEGEEEGRGYINTSTPSPTMCI